MPLGVGVIHLIGIGGIGISGIAEILHNLGYKVKGSDMTENYNVQRLRKLGIEVHIGHKAENVNGAAVVVKSTAVPNSNPEIIAAREQRIPVVKRAEMLAELTRLKASVAIAGTHGKTTTTSLVAMMFEAGGTNPTVINGGIINTVGTNAYLGKGEWLVVEADESDGTFIKIPSTIGVVTNIDPEHLDYWNNFDALRAAFRTFIDNLPFYGLGVLCNDHPEVRTLAKQITDRRILTYAVKKDADIKAVNIRSTVAGSLFDVEISEHATGGKARKLKGVKLPVPGRHNVQNSLAAIAIGLELGFDDKVITRAFEKFAGVKRRFTKTGVVDKITVIDDYGHHPVEIKATLATARDVQKSGKGRVIAVCQPHRYTRLNNLFDSFSKCFGDADAVVISEVYAAGETPIPGVTGKALSEVVKRTKKDTHYLEAPEKLAELINRIAKPNDLIVCLGAGTVTTWAHALPSELARIRKSKVS
ncbi:MAG: UDP-N-acetylmuramate--L-alanine ligase [Proteobacteria bacterium]|nr:UDP-N-acetylmuramate--L-alanine ligase [Pseudomonadota bacterium]